MKHFDTGAINEATDLRALAALPTLLLIIPNSSEPDGPCPRCGGEDRFHVRRDWWFCRQCYSHDNGQPHDAIAFMRWVEGLTFEEACQRLAGGRLQTLVRATPPQARRAQTAKPDPAWQDPAWQTDTQEELPRRAPPTRSTRRQCCRGTTSRAVASPSTRCASGAWARLKSGTPFSSCMHQPSYFHGKGAVSSRRYNTGSSAPASPKQPVSRRRRAAADRFRRGSTARAPFHLGGGRRGVERPQHLASPLRRWHRHC